jgi:heterotetrameric sarcosine oxidase gamma subunit
VLDFANESAFARLHSPASGNGVTVMERVGLGIAAVMVRRGERAKLSDAIKNLFGIRLPAGAEWIAQDGVTFLGTGPGKWLAISDANDTAFVQTVETKLRGLASVVEQSGGLGVLRLSSPNLFEMLAKGVQIDLAADKFPVGSVAVTSIAHIGVTLWKVDDAPTIDVAVARSFCGSFQHWLEMSASAHSLSPRHRPD